MPGPETVRALAALPENRGRVIAEGQPFEMPPCMPEESLKNPESYWQKGGRPCPFIELDPENEDAATLVISALAEHTRPLVPAMAENLLADLPADRRAQTLIRVSSTLRSDAVMQKMFPGAGDEEKK